MCETVGTKTVNPTAYHYVSPRQDNWDDLLAPLEFAVNIAYNESIQDTPFYLNYGRHPRH